jgi:hypothetical protein
MPQRDDKIPGLGTIEYAKNIMTRGHAHTMMKIEPFTSPAPMLEDYRPPIIHGDARYSHSPQNPKRPLSSHSDHSPSKRKDEDGRAGGQKQHSTESLFLSEAVNPAGEITSDRGQDVRKRARQESRQGIRDSK